MTPEYARIFVNDVPVNLLGDEARPRLSRVLQASGLKPAEVEVHRLRSSSDPTGPLVAADEILDRLSDPTTPIYLWSTAKAPADRAALVAQGDRIVAQLGRQPRGAPTTEPVPGANPAPPSAEDLELLDGDLPVKPILFRGEKRAQQQAAAEAEAEQRQEDQRELEGIEQDEAEAMDDARDDSASDS